MLPWKLLRASKVEQVMQGHGYGYLLLWHNSLSVMSRLHLHPAWNAIQLHEKCLSMPVAGLTRDWLELLPAEPWLLVSISAPASKCACAAARTLASQAMGEECPELSLPLQPTHRTQMANSCMNGYCLSLSSLSKYVQVSSLTAIWRAGHCNLLAIIISVLDTRLPAHSAQLSYTPA